jgi:hypothetical protein
MSATLSLGDVPKNLIANADILGDTLQMLGFVIFSV